MGSRGFASMETVQLEPNNVRYLINQSSASDLFAKQAYGIWKEKRKQELILRIFLGLVGSWS